MNLRRLILALCFLAAIAVGVLPRSRARAQAPAGDIVPGELLVGVKPAMDDGWQAARLTTNFGAAVAAHPALHVYRYRLRQGFSMQAAIDQLRKRPDVLYAEPNHILHVFSTPNDTFYASQQYGPQKVQADLAWGIWQPSAQVVLAIVDTGIDNTHPDLTNKILRDANNNVLGYNALTGVAGSASDDYGHGTHCAGIAAAQVNNGTGIAGISGWNGVAGATDTFYTKLMPVKVLDSSGSGTDASVASGITWATDHGAKVISMSLGGGGSSTLSNAVQYAWNHGVVVVAAAGNSSSSALSYPAAYANVISVAATDHTDTLTFYSNYGSWVQVAAPGGGAAGGDYIYSTTPTYAVSGGFPLNYGGASGTSMACPHVAGEAALILAQNPSLTNAQVKSLITSNVDPYNPYQGRTIAAGSGRINVYKALQAAGTGVVSPPAAPTNLVAAAGNAQVGLTWNASAGATGYNVKRATVSGGPYATVASNIAAAAYTDQGLTNGTTYYYVVSALNSAGESANSAQASATPKLPPPAAPTNVKAVAGNAQVTLSWTASAGAASYTVQRATVSGGPYATVPGGSGIAGTSFVDGGLTNGTTYYYVVIAVNAAGNSPNSAQVSATPTLAPPAAPTNVTAAAGNAQVTLSWTASAGATSYTVQRATVSGGPFATVPGGSGIAGASFVDGGLTNGTTYYYVVIAVNGGGSSPNSAQVSATPSAGGGPAPAPPPLVVAGGGTGLVSVTWKQSPTPGVTQYRLYRATVSGGPYAPLTTVVTASVYTTYQDKSVTTGTTYYYVVTAINSGGVESAYSNQASATAK